VDPYRSYRLSPNRSRARSRRIGESDEPLTITIRTDERARPRMFSGSPTVRWSITGTNATAVTACFSIRSSDSLGSNRSGSTNVEPSKVPIVKLRMPNEWNIGAGTRITSRRWNGTTAMRFSNEPSSERPDGRRAPFGRPTVPEVWIRYRGLPR
jgi:hypothetical protein